MIWPFENDTYSAVKRISKRDIQSEQIQSRLIVITISLTVAVIIAFYLLAAGIWQKDFNLHKNDAQVFISADSIQDVTDLKTATSIFLESPKVNWVGEEATVGVFKKDGSTVTVIYQSESQFEHKNHNSISITGNFPAIGNEIMLSQAYLDFLGSTADIGDNIKLDLTGQGKEQEYLISAIIQNDAENSNHEHRYTVYVSKDTANSLLSGEPLLWDTYIHFVSDADSEKEARQSASLILSDSNVQSLSVTINPDYPFGGMIAVQMNTVKTVAFFVMLLLVMDIMVISTIFTISINQRIRYYGQLRTIGMTTKQIRNLVSHEGRILARYGILIGGLLGISIGFFAHPNDFNIITAIVCWICVAAIILLTVKLSIKKPAKIASTISPIEAAKHLAYQSKKRCTIRKKRSLSSMHLALLNLRRNLGKTITTTLSLGVCGIVFMIVASFEQSYDAAVGQRFYFFPNGDMQISISNIGNSTFDDEELWSAAIRQRIENPLTEELQTEIASIDGVNKVQSSYGIYINVLRPNGWGDSAFQPVITKQQYEELIPAFTSKPITYEKLISSNGILVADSDDVFPEVGEIYKVTMVDKNGNPTDYQMPVMGTFSQDKVLELSPMTPMPYYLMASETVHSLTGAECGRYCLGVEYEESEEVSVEKALRNIVNKNSNLDFHSLNEQIQDDQQSTMSIVHLTYIFIIILFCFCIINLANTIETNVRVRQREFGLLQAVGMTSRQMRKMLQIENTFYLLCSSIITLSIGSIAGYFVCAAIDQSMHSISYHYPLIWAFSYIGSNVVLQVALSKYVISEQKKHTIIECIAIES